MNDYKKIIIKKNIFQQSILGKLFCYGCLENEERKNIIFINIFYSNT